MGQSAASMRSDHSRVLAFLLVWGVGAAPGQRLRRAGEAQRDFGPISSTDLATHFGDGLGRIGQRLQASPQQQSPAPFPEVFNSQQQQQQGFGNQQQSRFQNFPQQQFVQQQPQQQFPGGEPTGSIVKAELPQAPGVGSLFDSIVKKINNGHREKARRKQQSGSRGRNPAPAAAASSSDPFRAPLNRPRPSSDVQAPVADPFSAPVGRPRSPPLRPNPQQTSRAGPPGGAQSERRRGGQNGSRRPPAPALGLALFGRGEVAPAFENNPRAASSNFDGAAASIANETPRRQDDEAARKKAAMEKRLRELEEARVKELAEATLRDLENLRRKEEEGSRGGGSQFHQPTCCK